MAFEDIECVGPVSGLNAVPPDGVRVSARSLCLKGGGKVHYIALKIGPKLAKGIALALESHQLRLLFGTGADAGKVMVSVDNTAGKFAARRNKSGAYAVSINAATAEGLFALQFPTFAVMGIQPIRPEKGKPPHFVFKASTAMLAVED